MPWDAVWLSKMEKACRFCSSAASKWRGDQWMKVR